MTFEYNGHVYSSVLDIGKDDTMEEWLMKPWSEVIAKCEEINKDKKILRHYGHVVLREDMELDSNTHFDSLNCNGHKLITNSWRITIGDCWLEDNKGRRVDMRITKEKVVEALKPLMNVDCDWLDSLAQEIVGQVELEEKKKKPMWEEEVEKLMDPSNLYAKDTKAPVEQAKEVFRDLLNDFVIYVDEVAAEDGRLTLDTLNRVSREWRLFQ